MYIMRTIEPSSIQHLLSDFDNVLRMGLYDNFGAPLSKEERHQATLPVSTGGVGLPKLKNTLPTAYVSSVVSSTDLVITSQYLQV